MALTSYIEEIRPRERHKNSLTNNQGSSASVSEDASYICPDCLNKNCLATVSFYITILWFSVMLCCCQMFFYVSFSEGGNSEV